MDEFDPRNTRSLQPQRQLERAVGSDALLANKRTLPKTLRVIDALLRTLTVSFSYEFSNQAQPVRIDHYESVEEEDPTSE
jgi:hypothetical protein